MKLAWVAAIYGVKFLWSPLVDRLRIPLVTHTLGQRRSWMVLAQVGVLTGLLLLGSVNPHVRAPIVIQDIVALTDAIHPVPAKGMLAVTNLA